MMPLSLGVDAGADARTWRSSLGQRFFGLRELDLAHQEPVGQDFAALNCICQALDDGGRVVTDAFSG
jgi:hypothetical protein